MSGTCFGYEVDSPLAFHYLRPGTARTVLRITEDSLDEGITEFGDLLEETHPGDGGTIRVYSRPGEYHVWMQHAGWFQVDPHRPAITVPPSPHPEWREALIWGLPMALCLIERGDLVLHAASVEVNGRGLALAGPSGQGKSTLTAAFVRAGHRLLSDDLTPCRITDGWRVTPGPTLLRLRHETVARLPVPGSQQVAQDVDKVHLRVESGAGEVELAGLVLVKGPSGSPRLERADAVECLPDLWAVSLNIPTDEGRAHCFRQIGALAASLPVWELAIRPGVDELPEVVKTLIDTCLP
ncbi:MAG: hypothetical protein ACRDVL_02145 [Acidimicrobiia bacterium]